VSEPNVLVETVKCAEDEEALIVRLYEAAGGSRHARLESGLSVSSMDQVDLLERNPRPSGPELSLRAREVKTLRIPLP